MAAKLHALLVTATLALSLVGRDAGALDGLAFQVSGDQTGVEQDLRAASGLLAAQKARRTDATDLFADARAEYGRLLAALYATGHYGPVIHVLVDGREAADIGALDAPATISQISVSVDPGPVFLFSRAEIAPIAAGTVLPSGFAPGKVAEAQVIGQAVQASVDGWRGLGYAKTKVAGQALVADHATARLDALVRLNPGPQLRFGPLTVAGAVHMSDARLHEIAGLPQGTRFDPAQEALAADRLRRSGVFSSVAMSEDAAITAPDLLGIRADVVEAPPRRYTFGAEVASYDGILVSGSWLHRNLFGGGERLEFTGQVSGIAAQTGGIDYNLGVTLDRPASSGPDTDLNLGATISRVNDVDTTARVITISAGYTHYFSTTLSGQIALSLEGTDGNDAAGTYSYRSLDLPVSLTWDRRDSKTDPTKLFYLNLAAKPFYGFGATDNGARLAFDARGYKALDAGNKMVLAARVQGGAVLGARLLATPREDLFYSGGGGTVRGQAYQSLGVTVDENGTPVGIGGNRFLAGSLEGRLKVTEKIGVVGFLDAGLVGAQGIGSDWQAGAGFGVRYATGIGPVRLDIAFPVHGTGHGPQLYVGLGQAF